MISDSMIDFQMTPQADLISPKLVAQASINNQQQIDDSDFEINSQVLDLKPQMSISTVQQGMDESIVPLSGFQQNPKLKFRSNILPCLIPRELARDSNIHKRTKSEAMISKLPMIEPYAMTNSAAKFFKISRFSKFGQHEEPIDPHDRAKENQLIKNMEESFDQQYDDKPAPDVIGEHAEKKFYSHYKKIDLILQQNSFASIKSLFKVQKLDSIQTSMLSEAVVQNVVPCKIGVIKTIGDDTSVKIAQNSALITSNQRYGDRYASILSEGLKNYPSVRDYQLSNNRIKAHGAQALLTQIGKNARSIEIQSNTIGRLGIDAICASLASKDSKIEILNLEDNKLGNHNVLILLKGLSYNSSVKSLNLSKNFLSSPIAETLKNYISNNDHLEELYLFWNQIKGSGGVVLMEGLLNNDNLTVLDLSWNSLGMDNPQCTTKICEYLKKNKSAIHVDLSSNFFSKDQCKQIAESLKVNKTIYGFHFAGNFGFVDARGFLIVDDSTESTYQTSGTNRIQSVNQTHFNGINTKDSVLLKDVCWICQGWQEQEFKIQVASDDDPIFVHLQSEKYNPTYIIKKTDGSASLKLMIPPLITKFFYTVVEDQLVSDDYPSLDVVFMQKIEFYDKVAEVTLEKINYVTKPKRFNVIDVAQPNISILPRTPDNIYIPPKLQKVLKVWTFAISGWAKEFKFETEEILRKCFEKDWACSKVIKVVKLPDEQNLLKDILWKHYKMIKETYKNYSSYNPNGDVWSISSNPITEFCQSCELIDSKTLKLSDLDLKFIATCSASLEYKGNLRNPERALCRFQFMEFLVRLSEDKYVKNKIAQNVPEAIELLMAQCTKIMSQYDAQRWRDKRYFNEQCDDVCKYFKPMVNNVFARNSSKKVKPGQKTFMCLDELHDICLQGGLMDENFGERDANLAFNLSMLTQVDELEVDRIFQMSNIEFLEAIARIAEKSSPIALEADSTVEWNYETRSDQPLHLKLERVMVMLANTCAAEDYKNNYGRITKSLFQKSVEQK